MSTHYREACQYGFTHGQCRCPNPSKAVVRVECTTPHVHGRPPESASSSSRPVSKTGAQDQNPDRTEP